MHMCNPEELHCSALLCVACSNRRQGNSDRLPLPALQLPENVDPNQVDAKLENGQLRIVVPKTCKTEEEEPAHTVEIK